MIHQDLASNGNTYWAQQEIATTASSGVAITINDSAPTADKYNLAIAEILAAPPTLNANSGINGSDTYCLFDVSMQSHGTLSLTQPVHNNSTNVDTTLLQLAPPVRSYHVEAGFDASDQLVMNMYSTSPITDPTTTITDGLSRLQISNGGQLSVFDQSGSLVTGPTPTNAPPIVPLAFLGLAPGPTVLEYVITTDPQLVATSMSGTLQTIQVGPPAIKTVTVPIRSSPGGTMVLTYQSAGTMWILNTISASPALPNLQTTSTIQLSNLFWNVNSAGDTRRSSRPSTKTAPPSTSTLAVSTAPLAAAGTNALGVQQSFTAAAQNVVFQHGIFSSAATWNRMEPWLNPLFEFGDELTPSMPHSGTDRLATQGGNLITAISNSGQNDFILIGHSQGGLIARDVAQRRPDLALGVITVDTPHQGALLDLSGRAALAAGLTNQIIDLLGAGGCTSAFDNPGCFIGVFLEQESFNAVNYALDSAIPATQDLLPIQQNPYLQNLNAVSENFTRVGVEGHSDKRFVLERLGGDFIAFPDDTLGGRNIVRFTKVAYAGFRICEIIALIFGDCDVAEFCGGIADAMDDIDVFWDLVTAPGDSSDGIVQGASQRYPSATASYPISGADSHIGATKSDLVRDAISQTLDRQFFVPRAGCSFLLSPASTSISGAGGSGSLTVNTAINTPTNCSWSAVSNVPWITIPAGTHGVGTGAIPYTVSPNSATSSRSGTLSISGLIFTVTQTPAPDFSLSVTPPSLTVIQGQSVTYSVSGTSLNAFNGPVSLSAIVSPAGPTTSFSVGSITISGGGSGSSVLTLATSTTTPVQSYAVTITGVSGALTHSVAIALNVIPPPTSATGSLDIGGQITCSYSEGPSCDSGTLSVTINNTTETVNYNGVGAGSGWNYVTDPGSAVTLVQAVADAFNNDPNSPVTAVASFINPDSIVVFTTKAKGAGTNYFFTFQLFSTHNAQYPDSGYAQGLVVTPSSVFSLTGGVD